MGRGSLVCVKMLIAIQPLIKVSFHGLISTPTYGGHQNLSFLTSMMTMAMVNFMGLGTLDHGNLRYPPKTTPQEIRPY